MSLGIDVLAQTNSTRLVRTQGLLTYYFTVIDERTGLPIHGAQCSIWELRNCGEGEGDGSVTDFEGKAVIDAQWFTPRSWSVKKLGYHPICSNEMGTRIDVALAPTTEPEPYTVKIYSSVGGMTQPQGAVEVEIDSPLTVTAYPYEGYKFNYWMFKGHNAGSGNPQTFMIDRDGISIVAIFEEIPPPPEPVPPNGEPPEPEPPGPAPPNGEPLYFVPVHVFDKLKLKAEWSDMGRSKTQSVVNIDTSLLKEARLEYTVQYVRGMPVGETAKIALDGINIIKENLKRGEAKSGVMDVTGRIGRSVSITIGFESFVGIWSEVMFDVWLVLGYSEQPPVDPNTPFNWEELIRRYGPWVALGTTGLVVLSLMRKPVAGGPVIVMPGTGLKDVN